MKWSGVILGLACLCALIGVGGCDDSDSGRRMATPTASAPATPIAPSPTHTPIRVGETPPPAHTDTPSEDRSPTARPSPLDSATPTDTSMPIVSSTPMMCPFTQTPGASPTTSGSPTATYTELICPAKTVTPTPAGACTVTVTATSTGTAPPPPPTPTQGFAVLSWFDANPRYTSGVFLPLREYSAASVRVLTTAAWTMAARRTSGASADGATLLLVGVRLLDSTNDAPVQLRIDADIAPSGGLFAVDDQRLVDRSPDGGAIDDLPDGPTDLSVATVLVDGQRWAFALYRAPRDYDPADPPLSSRTRAVTLSALQDGELLIAGQFDIIRPLVIFLHGTGGDTSNWDPFPLWRDSANELNGFRGGMLPFYADRVSFQWISLAAGHLTDNGATVLAQLGRAIESWKTSLNAAATQADVVTHSYGGPVARQAAQTQPDADPLTTSDQANFRAATNWGHGLVHKLVTLAGSHRGSALANSTAYLNQLRSGALRTALCLDGLDIAAGAFADQLVISPALANLQETRVPGHAVIGSGSVRFVDAPFVSTCFSGGCEVCYPAAGYHGEFSLYQSQDAQNGPYKQAGDLGGTFCGLSAFCEVFNHDNYDRLSNYTFNLAYVPPFPYPDCDLSDFPNYDLTVSACSSRGQLPRRAYSTVDDIDSGMRGRLSHAQLLTTRGVSDRVRFLLQQPTTSDHFAHFAATGGPTCLEQQIEKIGSAADLNAGTPCASGPDGDLINSCYNSCNSCEADSNTPPCFVEYRVVPDPLVFRQTGEAAPVFVYGRVARGPLDGRWTNVQSLANQIWCSVSMTSDNTAVAGITTWTALSGIPDQSGINVIQAVADGRAGVTLTVENDSDGPLGIEVVVDTTPAASAE